MDQFQPLQSFSEGFHLTTLPLHAHEILAASLVYYTTFLYVSPALSAWLLPSNYPQLPARTKVNWDIRVVSLLNAVSISAFALAVLIWGDGSIKADWAARLWGYSGPAGQVQACAAGYFLWDVAVSATNVDILGVGSLVHAVCALLITSIGFRPFANFYGLNFILYELSTPFLNVHWFLDKLNLTGSRLQYWNGLALVAVFFGCRLVWGTYQSVNLYRDAWCAWKASATEICHPQAPPSTLENLSYYVSGSKTSNCAPALPMWLLILYLASNTVLSMLNFYWFGRMIVAVRKRFQGGSETAQRPEDRPEAVQDGLKP